MVGHGHPLVGTYSSESSVTPSGIVARDADVAHQHSPDGCECLVERLAHLRQAEREPDEPEAARVTVAPATRPGRPDAVRGDPLRGDDLERRDVHRAPDGAGER